MKYKLKIFIKYLFVVVFVFFAKTHFVNASVDSDNDGVPDKDEVEIYKTDPQNKDTDGDGYSDWVELNNGYSPHNPEIVKLEDNDLDQDLLSDRMELNFHTDLKNPDTDGDGFEDGVEINNYYDPLQNNGKKLTKKIEIDLNRQKLYYFLSDVRMGEFSVSTGKKSMPTPKGVFEVASKTQKAWSSNYGLWMPYWMGLGNGSFGIHELPVWPNGYREGENHLGIPVSHGCIRLGIGPAKFLYDWGNIGMSVKIY